MLVRPFGGPRLEDKLRVTVGTPMENDAFLAGLAPDLRRGRVMNSGPADISALLEVI